MSYNSINKQAKIWVLFVYKNLKFILFKIGDSTKRADMVLKNADKFGCKKFVTAKVIKTSFFYLFLFDNVLFENKTIFKMNKFSKINNASEFYFYYKIISPKQSFFKKI